MRPTARGKSNTKKVPPSQLLEQEAIQMEEKLKALKRQMNGEKMKREQQSQMNTSQSRWAASSTSKPLKNFAKGVIKEKNEYIEKNGGKLGGTGSFQKPQQKQSLNKTQQNPILKQGNNNRPNSAKKGNFLARPSSNQGIKENKNLQNLGILPQNQSSKEILGQSQQQNAQNNLQKHIQMQKQAEPDHVTFLKDINLIKYQDKFEQNGFDDLDAIIELNTELLNEMMIPAGHQIKIMKKVDKIRKEKNIEPQQKHILQQYKQKEQTQPPKPTQPQQTKKRTDLVELEYQEPVVEKHSIAIGDDNDTVTQPKQQKPSAFDGEFDERESHNSFLEALYEFRGQKPPQQQEQQQQQQQKPKQRKSVSFEPEVQDNEGKSSQYRKKKTTNTTTTTQNLSTIPENDSVNVKKEEPKKGGLFFMGGGSTYNNDDYKPVTNIDGDTQTINKEIPVGEKIGCWVCYKLFLKSKQINYSGKSFCSQKCYQSFQDSQSVKCNNEKCKKDMIKTEAQFTNGAWYCNEKCAPSLETIVLQMRQKQLEEQKEIDFINQKKQQQEEEEKSVLDEQQIADLERSFVKTKQAAQNKKQDSGDIDLNNDNDEIENKSQILTMEQLELKYKMLNMKKEQQEEMKKEHQQQKQQNDNKNEVLDDSLEM